MPKVSLIPILLFVVIAAGPSASMRSPNSAGWQLVWSDEFNAPDGSLPNAENWSIDVGGHGWGNQELEYYTARPQNVHIEKGNLVITALRESYTDDSGVHRNFTSARIHSDKKFEQQYGRVEARIKIPRGQGVWPAFWMMGNDFRTAGWPACGEIDVMENVGYEPGRIHGSVHGPGQGTPYQLTASYSLGWPRKFWRDYHLFAVEWEPEAIRFYVDGLLYQTFTPNNTAGQGRWVFRHPFFLLLNLAVGGTWPGAPSARTPFPVSMLVDYVRVYRRAGLESDPRTSRAE